jgi:endonuclease-8
VRPIAARRRQQIVALTGQRGVVSVRELCDALGVSDMTIRRDFRALERQGALQRTHGGAVAISRPTFNYTYDERQRLQREAKDAIGAAAAALVEAGDTLFLGSGTTVLALARRLRGREAPLKAALLDQRLVAGIGNLRKAEALWHARLSPWLRLDEVSNEELRRVLGEAARLMRASLEAGRQERAIYRRAGRACPRCGERISSGGQGDDNRTAYWCPGCQRG